MTGIPNFDNAATNLDNNFPHRNYVLVATSSLRETFGFDNRAEFIQRTLKIAAGRKIIYKLHPNENVKRATAEIHRFAPDALVYTEGNTNHMIANCDVLITQSCFILGLLWEKRCTQILTSVCLIDWRRSRMGGPLQ